MATKARQQYFADEDSLQKIRREFSIADDIQQKIDSIEEGAQVNVIETVKVNGMPLIPDANKAVNVEVPEVIDNLYTIDSDNALSAKQGKLLYDYIQNIASRGRFLSNWNSATGLPMTNPSESPYPYKSGDYFVVSNVAGLGGTNYRPDGSSYIIGQASTVVETESVDVSDFYFYDGTNWLLLKNSSRSGAVDSSLSTTSTNPVENRVITNALNGKQETLIAGNNIQIAADGKTISATDTTYTAGTGINIDANNVISNTQTSAEWGNITGTLSNQTDLQNALNNKANKTDVLEKTNTTSYTPSGDYNPATKKYVDDSISAVDVGDKIEYVTQAEYNALLPGAESDGKHYFIYTSSKLPSAYQEVEWIETSGSQYINTGIVPTNMATELKFEVTSATQDLKLFGTDLGSSAGDYYHLTPYSNSWYFGVNGGEGHGGTYSNVVGTQYVVVFNDSNGDLVANDIIQTSCAGTTSTAQIQIAKRGNHGGMGKYKYFYFNLYDKTTSAYVMKLVPCYRKLDSVIGMYDLISDTFFTNAGTGTFIKGPDV